MQGHGGGIIKFKFMLLALAIAICITPLSVGLANQNMDQNAVNSEIKNQQVSNVNSAATAAPLVQVNAAKKYKKKYKKVYAKKRYKKVYRTSKKYKKVYRTKKVWSSRYHRYVTVRAAYTYKTTVSYFNSVRVTSTTVTATAKCSCGALGNYNLHTATFQNYDPKCHKSGTLTWNPKGTAEGEWTCSACGADYCAACGKIKIKGSNIHLTPA